MVWGKTNKHPRADQIFRILNPAQGGIQKVGLHFVPTKNIGTSFRMTMTFFNPAQNSVVAIKENTKEINHYRKETDHQRCRRIVAAWLQ